MFLSSSHVTCTQFRTSLNWNIWRPEREPNPKYHITKRPLDKLAGWRAAFMKYLFSHQGEKGRVPVYGTRDTSLPRGTCPSTYGDASLTPGLLPGWGAFAFNLMAEHGFRLQCRRRPVYTD